MKSISVKVERINSARHGVSFFAEARDATGRLLATAQEATERLARAAAMKQARERVQ